MIYFEEIGKLWSLLREMLGGTLVTVEIWAFTLLFSLPLGLLFCLAYLSDNRLLRGFSKGYIFFFRGTPLLLQVILIFFGMPLLGLKIDRIPAAIVAFALNYAAYFAEIYRGGMQSIPRGQYEAAHVLGLSGKVTFFKVILPQVIKRVLPPMGNEIITLVKDTALVYAIAANDLMKEAKVAMLRDFSFIPLIIAAIFYLVMTGSLTSLFRRVERRFDYYK
jgi:polar amino acid transport system permease protein